MPPVARPVCASTSAMATLCHITTPLTPTRGPNAGFAAPVG
jgi:hypothetical protein